MAKKYEVWFQGGKLWLSEVGSPVGSAVVSYAVDYAQVGRAVRGECEPANIQDEADKRDLVIARLLDLVQDLAGDL